MADELANLRGEYNQQKEKLDEAISQISELKEQNNKLNDEIAELKAQIKTNDDKKFMQKNSTKLAGESANSIPTILPNKRSNKESSDLVAKMEAKRPKLLATCVPNWLVEVLAWIKRIEMADSFLPTACSIFNQLCWPKLHGKHVKPHSADYFIFSHHFDKWGNIHAKIKHFNSKYKLDEDNPHCGYPFCFPIPVPCVPPPAYIHGFKAITFKFLDDELVEFTKGILHLMKNVSIVIDMEMSKLNCGDKSVALMNRLFDVVREKILNIQFSYGIEIFCKIFPGFIKQAQTLSLQNDIQIQSEKEISLLVDCLANPWRNEHAKQKCLVSPFSNNESSKFERDFIDRIIDQFANASQAQVYFVCLGWNRQMHDEFTLENKETDEVLALYYKIHPTYNEKFLMRYPKGEEQKWKELGENKSFFYWNQGWPLNTLFLDIKKFATNNI